MSQNSSTELKAIALRLNHTLGYRSKVETLGSHQLAKQMIRAANRYGINILNNNEITDFLFGFRINQEIPDEISSLLEKLLASENKIADL